MSKSMSCLNIAAPGEAFYTVWYVEQIAHAALSIDISMLAGSTELAMSISEVRIISVCYTVFFGKKTKHIYIFEIVSSKYKCTMLSFTLASDALICVTNNLTE